MMTGLYISVFYYLLLRATHPVPSLHCREGCLHVTVITYCWNTF